jgi:hypothetical protein
MLLTRIRRQVAERWAWMRAHPDRGAETVDKVLWMAVTIVVVGAVGLLFRDAVTDAFNALVFEIGLGSGSGSGG